ncbi:MAG: 4-alpha-glucanotransferase [Candidatus Cloacimonadota bacterium]|nr:4-alpha-glucanotransferase [Candidatus Cloacimonadota bacterium]
MRGCDIRLNSLTGIKLLIHYVQKIKTGKYMTFKRSAGILLHPSSLTGKFGMGNIGKEAFDFIDFLAKAKQTIWQILPLNFPGYGNSPYNPISAFANNPLLIDLTRLIDQGLISNLDLENSPKFLDSKVEFHKVEKFKIKILKSAFEILKNKNNVRLYRSFKKFCFKNQQWLNDFALFASLREHHQGKSWNTWEKNIRNRKSTAIKIWEEQLSDQIEFQKFLQYIFAKQWRELKLYANEKRVKIVGDIPIYVAYDSADVWANQDLFKLNKDGNPTVVAGVPPDYFSPTGQLWGNPIYNWVKMQHDDFQWWQDRIANLLENVDYVRIDHFIGFVRNWQVAYGKNTAEQGEWLDVPGEKLLSTLKNKFGELPIIAEDLGALTKEVIALRDQFGFPGMLPLQFAFGDNFVPLNEFPQNKIIYSGTHDNDTTLGWFRAVQNHEPKIYQKLQEVLNSNEKNICRDMIEFAYSSPCIWAITSMQDVLALGTKARMNTPGTVGGNWEWRLSKNMLTDKIANRLAKLTNKYNRFPPEN